MRECTCSFADQVFDFTAIIKPDTGKEKNELSFLFDINFDESLRILSEEGCIEGLCKAPPDKPEIRDIAVELRKYFLDKKGVELFHS